MESLINIFNRLKSFKNSHYALAQWIVSEIRVKGSVFKAYYNNNRIIPVLINKANRLSPRNYLRNK